MVPFFCSGFKSRDMVQSIVLEHVFDLLFFSIRFENVKHFY